MFSRSSAELQEAHAARDRAVRWLLDHIASDGEPADAAERNGWSRLGWGLAAAGEIDAAAAVVAWAEANRIGNDGSFFPGRTHGQGYISQHPNYWLGTFVVSAWMVGRADLALRSMDYLRSQQDKRTGGLPMRMEQDGKAEVCDMLSTAQVGLSALVTGQHDVADLCFRWVNAVAEQLAQDSLLFHMCRLGNAPWTTPDPAQAWAARVDFGKPRQAFYGPGMGAVFLAPYAHLRREPEALDAARRLLMFNILGHEAQFTDLESVQACKFGWAVGVMHQLDREGDWLPWVNRMTRWFIDRQSSEGWWGPSRFADPNPSYADRLVKTSEHVMELSALIAALGAAQQGRDQSSDAF